MFVNPHDESINNTIDNYIFKGPHNNIKDPKLKQALDIICKILADNENFVADTHTGNIMWRVSNGELQLVLTDPIAGT
jgi:hypothetical protein